MAVTTTTETLFSDIENRRSRLPVRAILVAIGLHLLLLGLPGDPEPARAPILEVALELEPPEVAAPVPPTRPMEAPESITPPVAVEPAVLEEQAVVPEKIAEATPPNDTVASPETPPAPVQSAEIIQTPTPTSAQLLDAITQLDWTTPIKQTPQASGAPATLARSTDSEALKELYRPLIAASDNVFDGMTAPSSVQVVDRWLEPGGAHQVVMRSPDGNTYCGRQEAVDDFRPWLQMPMMLRKCGGGGKRSGKQGWRNN